MIEFWQSPSVQRALWGLAVSVVVVGALLVVAVLTPPLTTLLYEIRERLGGLRARLRAWANESLGDRAQGFWRERCAEPMEPVLAGLRRIDAAAATLGREQVGALLGLETKLQGHLRVLSVNVQPQAPERLSDRERLMRGLAHGGIGTVIFLLVFGAALGLINAMLLSAFFREFLGTRSPIPTLFPRLQMGHVIAVVVFLAEVSAGWAIHHYSHLPAEDGADLAGASATRERKGPEKVMYGFGWFLVIGLCLSEAVAYGILSRRIGAAAALGIGPGNVFYWLVEYFLAVFGVCVAGGLAMVGYSFEEAVRRRRRAKVERDFLKALVQRDATIEATIDKVRQNIVHIRDAVDNIPRHVADSFQAQLGLNTPFRGAPVSLYDATVSTLATTAHSEATALVLQNRAIPSAPPVRTRTQVIADLLVHLTFAVFLTFATVATALQVIAWVAVEGLQIPLPIAGAMGVALPVGGIVIGFLSWSALDRARYASVVEQRMREPAAKRTLGWVLAAVGALFVLLLTVLAGSLGFFVAHPVLSALVGAFFGAVLVGLGGVADRVLVAVAHAGYLLYLASIRALAAVLGGLGVVAGALCSISAFVLRLLAVPGDVIIRAFRGREARPAAPLALP